MHEKPYVVEVDGTQVFSADFVFQQMQAQNRRINRARAIAIIAFIIAAASIALYLWF